MEKTLRSFTLPLQGLQAILPHSSLVEVLPYSAPLKLQNAPPWVLGALLWRNLNVPVVSLEWLIYDTGPGAGAYSRIAMTNTLGKDPRLPYFGLLGSRAPQLINLERNQLALDEATGPLKPGVLSWVKLNDQRACIPDVNAIEAQLIPLIYHA